MFLFLLKYLSHVTCHAYIMEIYFDLTLLNVTNVTLCELKCPLQRVTILSQVARSLVSVNLWLFGIKIYRFSWYVTWVSANHASSNSAQNVWDVRRDTNNGRRGEITAFWLIALMRAHFVFRRKHLLESMPLTFLESAPVLLIINVPEKKNGIL